MSAAAGPYAGLERFRGAKRVVADLDAGRLLENVSLEHTHAVGHATVAAPLSTGRLDAYGGR